MLGDCMSEALLQKIYKILSKRDIVERIIMPEEEISEEENKELEKLKEESLKGENARWDGIKKELLW